jgi:hypothetical protein
MAPDHEKRYIGVFRRPQIPMRMLSTAALGENYVQNNCQYAPWGFLFQKNEVKFRQYLNYIRRGLPVCLS